MQKISRIKSSGERLPAARRVIDSSSNIASISSQVREGRRASGCGIRTSFRDAIWGVGDQGGYGEWRLYGAVP